MPGKSESDRRRLKAEIFGDVQGVGFRFFAERHARRLGLEGYVRNRYDGAVEVEAEGTASLLEQFLNDLRHGPRAARVQDVKVSWTPPRGDLGPFGVRG
ncbi:MAG TPA: acylphosphatase [Candidatus Dormibacteraeota bacterium]|nr:acylphosphatase [Candidatus Dormibacteraeota bacterium]